MKVREEFVIAESPQTLWEFFEQLDEVARCVPGVEEVTVVDADNSRVKVTQALGPMTATFDVKMRITARDPGRSMEFTAVGRSVRGAAGNVRATHTVHLHDESEGSTRVALEGDLALGGMLGSVGQKVVAKQASIVTAEFAQALERRLSNGGEAPPAGSATEALPVEPPSIPPSLALEPASRGRASTAIAGGAALAALVLVIRWLRSRSR